MNEKDNLEKDIKKIRIENSTSWEPFMKKYKCDKICELGIFRGDNFMQMIAHKPSLAVAIDSWKDNGVHPRPTDDYTQEEFDEQYSYFKNRVKNKSFVQIVKDTTLNASKMFSDNYFDLVFVDADHSFEGCFSDLHAWYPKVKPGKFLMGHDFAHRLRNTFGVFNAVNKFTTEMGLKIYRFGMSNWAVIKQ